MNIVISHPIALKVYNYFTNYEERHSRKTFMLIMLALSIFVISIYVFGTDFKAVQTLQIDLNKEISSLGSAEKLTPETALQQLMEDDEFVNGFTNKLSDSIPSMFWICLTMLLSIPTIIKRTNDTFIHKNHAYPVVIYYALYFFQGLTGIYINFFMIYTALALYSSIFVLLISFIPSKKD